MHRDSRISQFPNGQPAIFFQKWRGSQNERKLSFWSCSILGAVTLKFFTASGAWQGAEYLLLLIFFNNLYNMNSFCLYDSFCDLFPQTRKQTCKIFAYADNKLILRGSKMALTKETTAATIKKYGAKDTDTGSVKVQIALMTQRVQQLTAHVKQFPKDGTAKRSLLKVVGQRRKMLKYFERTDLEGYRAFIKELGLRK